MPNKNISDEINGGAVAPGFPCLTPENLITIRYSAVIPCMFKVKYGSIRCEVTFDKGFNELVAYCLSSDSQLLLFDCKLI